MEIKKYTDDKKKLWDDFLVNSVNGNFLHSKKFLNYHGDKFIDFSLLIYEENNLIGILPAAIHPSDKKTIVSHPGITFGGLIHNRKLKGQKMYELFTLVTKFYSNQGFNHFIYKSIPSFYNQIPIHDDVHALFRLNSKNIRSDLSSTLNLKEEINYSKRRKRSLKKTLNYDLKIDTGDNYLTLFWEILSENLQTKFGVKPTHNISEISYLANLFPKNIECVICLNESRVIAGVILFKTSNVIHSQYISANEEGKAISGLDFIFDYLIKRSIEQKFSWFNFGISTEENGYKLNENLYKYKSEFGSGSTLYNTYQIDL